MLLRNPVFSQGVKVKSGNMIFLSGQVALDKEGILQGEDFSSQFVSTLENVSTVLEGMGANWKNVVHLRIYVVDLKPEHRFIIGEILGEIFENQQPPANTLIGIHSLARKDLRVEIEAVAISD